MVFKMAVVTSKSGIRFVSHTVFSILVPSEFFLKKTFSIEMVKKMWLQANKLPFLHKTVSQKMHSPFLHVPNAKEQGKQ